MLSRRSMLSRSAIALGLGTMSGSAYASPASSRKFTLDLRCGSIGVKADQREAMALAAANGFESVNAEAGYLAKLGANERKEIAAQLKEKGLQWGAGGLPVGFRDDEATFRSGAQNLPKLAAAMQDVGVTRVGTYLMPCHGALTYVENFRQHARRLRECTKILGDHGQRLGLEYVGPKTLWTSKRYPFVHCMAETKNLIDEIGEDNVGFVLDSWHWYTAGESVRDLKSITNDDIVACDLNDAPRGRALDAQIDNQRELPAATGVIDLKAFLGALVELGYDGPVRAEPFNRVLNEMDNDKAVATTANSMKKAFALIGG
ncbi:MAG: sugar phosphate isomerase/epimerase family protein [Rubripirellula sp.]